MLVGGVAATLAFVRAGAAAAALIITNQYSGSFISKSLVVTPTFRNTSNSALIIKEPQVTVYYGDTIVGVSDPANKQVNIPANGTSKTTINVAFDLVNLAFRSPAIYQAVIAGQPVQLKVTSRTGILTPAGIINVPEKTDYITLGGGRA